MKSKFCMVLLWVMVFLLGGMAGAVGYHLYCEQKPKSDDFIEEMARDLKLDAQQTESLREIFDEAIKRYRELKQQYQPQFKTIRNETDEKIKSILRPDQQLLFEERLKKFRQSKHQSPSPHQPPPSQE